MAGASVAQTTFSLQGSLKDSKGEPMMFTNCVLLHQADSAFAYGTTSDLDGVFSLTGVKQGEKVFYNESDDPSVQSGNVRYCDSWA